MKSQSVTIWAMVSYRHCIIHHVFNGTVNGENYAHLLETVVLSFFRRKRNCIYQQDGAPAHWSLAVRNLLNTHLPNRWIGRDGPIKCPPRSFDLSINDFWLWGYVRDNVYKPPKCRTLPDLTERICNFLDRVSAIGARSVAKLVVDILNNFGNFDELITFNFCLPCIC